MKSYLLFVLACIAVALPTGESMALSPTVGSRPTLDTLTSRFEAQSLARAEQLRTAWVGQGHIIDAAAPQPAILSGTINTPTVYVNRPPAAPKVTVSYQTGSSGLEEIQLGFYSPSTFQYLYITLYVNGLLPPETKKVVILSQPLGTANDPVGAFGFYAAPGTWTMYNATIYDRSGASTYYSQSQLSALFPTLNLTVVNNGSPDVTPPTLVSGKILTPTVKLSSAYPLFETNLQATDSLSGVHEASVFVTAPSGSSGDGFTYLSTSSEPVNNGTIETYTYVSPTTGTWTISGIEVCDLAGNCLEDTNPEDIQAIFGTTKFQVKD